MSLLPRRCRECLWRALQHSLPRSPDDQRADTIAALGNTHISTPNLDRLVREGTVFTRAYCMGSQQGAVCVPSRAMLLTGRTLFHVRDDLENQDTWPEAFGRPGYTTFLTGKWHNEPASALRVVPEGQVDLLRRHGRSVHAPARGYFSGTFARERPSQRRAFGAAFADAASEFLRESVRGFAVPLLRGIQRAA